MLDKEIKLSDLQVLLDKTFGSKAWVKWEPETIMLEFGSADTLLMEKIYVLQALNHNLNAVISLPEFLLWTTSVANNELAQFETVSFPTSLELAWALEQVKKIGLLTGQAFTPSSELAETLAYLLRIEGYSEPLEPFNFIPASKFEPGQTKEDTVMKKIAITKYIEHMESSHA